MLLAVGLLAIACDQPSDDRFVDLEVPVTVQPVGTRTMESTVTATGTLRPARQAELTTRIEGDIFFLPDPDGEPLSEGAPVAKGQVIARLENEEWLNGLRIESREMAVQNAEKNLEDTEMLFREGLGPANDVETARKALVDARTDLDGARIQLRNAEVRAQVDGWLAELADLTEGTRVAQDTVIGKVVDYADVLLELKIPGSQIASVRRGQPVRVSNYAFSDEVFTGRISVLDPTLDETTRTFRVEARVDNSDLLLRPGMFVKADIVTESRPEVLAIPREVVQMRQNREVVFLENDGRAQMRQITTGLEQDGWVEVVDGLEVGDRLIVGNYETLRTRTQVRVTAEEPAIGPGG